MGKAFLWIVIACKHVAMWSLVCGYGNAYAATWFFMAFEWLMALLCLVLWLLVWAWAPTDRARDHAIEEMSKESFDKDKWEKTLEKANCPAWKTFGFWDDLAYIPAAIMVTLSGMQWIGVAMIASMMVGRWTAWMSRSVLRMLAEFCERCRATQKTCE